MIRKTIKKVTKHTCTFTNLHQVAREVNRGASLQIHSDGGFANGAGAASAVLLVASADSELDAGGAPLACSPASDSSKAATHQHPEIQEQPEDG